jgi:predicted MFS family arabinose efflux permease
MHTQLTARRELLLLLSLAGIQFTHIVDFMIMMPLGPQLTSLFGISFAEFGLLVSAYTVAAGLSGLFATTFIDRFDRKRLLLTLYVLFALTTVACGIAPTYGWLMAARIASGFFGGVLSTMTQTIIGDVVPFERRGRATGIVMTSFSVATVAGVPAGLFFAKLANLEMFSGKLASCCIKKFTAPTIFSLRVDKLLTTCSSIPFIGIISSERTPCITGPGFLLNN